MGRKQVYGGWLTDREQEVVYILAQGHTITEIGEILCIARVTTATHLCNIYWKLDTHTLHQTVAYYYMNIFKFKPKYRVNFKTLEEILKNGESLHELYEGRPSPR